VKVERSVLTTINEDVMLCDHHHHHHVFSHMEKCTFTDNYVYMCELDYETTSDADNNPEINVSQIT